MKRVLPILLAGTTALLAACGSSKETSQREIILEKTTAVTTEAQTEPSSVPAVLHERHDYEDGVLVGRWEGTEADILIQDNGKISAEFDISDVMMIDDDGTFMLSGEEHPTVQYDGTTLNIFTNGENGGEPVSFLTLKRADESEQDGYDGLYDIDTENFRQKLAELVTGSDYTDSPVQIRIRYGKFRVCLPEFCDYTQKGDEFTLSMTDGGSISDYLSDSTFVLDGDHVTFYNAEGITEQFDRTE